MNTKRRPETLAATALGREDESTGAITLPLYPSTKLCTSSSAKRPGTSRSMAGA
jgi:hypothetical protein